MLITAFLMAPATLLAPFTYLHMIWATMYGYLVFGQLPDKLSGSAWRSSSRAAWPW
jgi:hypothetical protein